MRTHDPLHHPPHPPHAHTTTRRPVTYTSTEGRGAVAAHVARPGEAVAAVVARAHPPLAVFRDLEPEALLVVHLGAVAMVEVTGYHHATWHKQKQGHSSGKHACRTPLSRAPWCAYRPCSRNRRPPIHAVAHGSGTWCGEAGRVSSSDPVVHVTWWVTPLRDAWRRSLSMCFA